MEKVTVPPSPTWYLSQVFDCSWDNRLAYGAYSSLVVIDPTNLSHPIVISSAHGDRILSVSFAPKNFGNFLLSTCNKGLSMIWNLDTSTSVSFNRQHKNSATYGNWSHAFEDVVVCADESGGVSWWDVKLDVLNFTTFAGHIFNIVACCPHRKDLVALGTKQGNTCVISLKGKGSILHKLSDHSSEITSIVWYPLLENPFRAKSVQDEFLLCSASRDRSAHFWQVGKSQFCEARIELPAGMTNMNPWTCLCWPHPSVLLASAVGGEVYSLLISDILKSKSGQLVGRAANRDKKIKWQQFLKSVKHGRGSVAVHSQPWRYCEKSDKYDWRAETSDDDVSKFVWTSGADRLIYGITMKNGKEYKVDVKVNTIGGVVHALAVSPIDGHSLAIGTADRSIRVVNLSEPSFCNMKSFHIKYNAKVMAVAWHPEKEDWLAYGTSDGHVDIHSAKSNKVHLSFLQHTKESIYVLQWGPKLLLSDAKKEVIEKPPLESESVLLSDAKKEVTEEPPLESESVEQRLQYALYSVGGGKIAMFDPDKKQNPSLKSVNPIKGLLPVDVESAQEKSKFTDLSWKPDYSVLAVGNDRGSILLFYLNSQKNLQFISCVTEHITLIQDLAWHPESCTTDSSERSPYVNWLASASNDVNIRVLDVTSALAVVKNCKDSLGKADLKVFCVATLAGHRMRVAKVAWSPHQSGQLLSASYDQCVQVWDVPENSPIACYVHHGGPVLTCLLSPVFVDSAISGGMDTTLRLWNVCDQDQKVPIEKKSESKRHLKDAREVALKADDKSEDSGKNAIFGSESVCLKCKRGKEKSVLPVSGNAINDESLNSQILQHLLNMDEKECQSQNFDSSKPVHFGLFAADEGSMAELLSAEHKENCSSSSFDRALVIDIWRGRVNEAITEAIRTKRLSDFHVSLAPMVSPKVWTETCVAYAEQLKEKKEYSKASAFLLAIHRVEDAIKLLADNGMYRHAVAVARSRLPQDDPLILELLNDWAQESIQQGKLSVASLCLAATGHWNDAARLMVRKQNVTRLIFAAEIMASKGKDRTTGLLYARESLCLSLKERDWITSKKVLQTFSDLKHFSVLFLVHQSLSNFLNNMTPIAEWLSFLALQNGEMDVHDSTENHAENGKESAPLVNEPVHISPELVLLLENDTKSISTDKSVNALWLAVSCRVALAAAKAPFLFPHLKNHLICDGSVANHDSSTREALALVVEAMTLLYNQHIMLSCPSTSHSLLLKFCMWLLPNGKLGGSISLPLQQSIRAYVAVAILFWLESTENSDHETCSKALHIIDLFKTDLFSNESLKRFKVDFQLTLLKAERKAEESSVHGPKCDTSCTVGKDTDSEVLITEDQEVNGSSTDAKCYMEVRDKESIIDEQSDSGSKTQNNDKNAEIMDSLENLNYTENKVTKQTQVSNSKAQEVNGLSADVKCNIELNAEASGKGSSIDKQGDNGSKEDNTDKNREIMDSCKASNSDKKYESLMSWLQNFEEERGKVPNPYLCYGRLAGYLKNSNGKVDETLAKSFSLSFENFWRDTESQSSIN